MGITIEEDVFIIAPPERVWGLLTDTSTWPSWNTSIFALDTNKSPITLNSSIRFSVCISGICFIVEPRVKSLQEHSRIVWTGSKFWVHSQHEFLLMTEDDGTRLISTERLSGLPVYLPGFPSNSIRQQTRRMLDELKAASEVPFTS